jgi:succinate dehydrogenase / fumarate reductase cytochrome b subunit
VKIYASANPAKYKVGMWAFVLHRLSGLLLALYLVVHLVVISTATIRGRFDSVMDLFHKPWVIVMELALIAVVIYHLLNGIRLLLFDVGIGLQNQKPIFWGLMAAGVVMVVFAAMALWPLITA